MPQKLFIAFFQQLFVPVAIYLIGFNFATAEL